jgi:hypothetical protein
MCDKWTTILPPLYWTRYRQDKAMALNRFYSIDPQCKRRMRQRQTPLENHEKNQKNRE